jgi:2-hydroxychromene-2-carboxylate isomerase
VAQSIDFFFFPASTYTYLTVNRISSMARQSGVIVRWRPFNLRAILRETGVVPYPAGSAKQRYMWRDLARQARMHDIQFPQAPPPYPSDPDLLNLRMALVAENQGWIEGYTQAAYRSWFLDHKPPGMGDNMNPLLNSLGKDAPALLSLANSEAITLRLEETAQLARDLGLFGSPMFKVGDELFWGDDRLETAISWATGTS